MSLELLLKIFVPHDAERRAQLEAGQRLVHYTTAEAAYKIITGKQVWLRNALLMNDFSEMQYGLNCLQSAWASQAGDRLRDWLDRVVPGLKDEVVSTFDAHADGLKVATFMMALSEHEIDEDEIGRLSMWRAYGGKNGVALVLNPTIFTAQTDGLKAYSAPVIYQTPGQFSADFALFVDRLIENEDQLNKIDKASLVQAFFYTFRLHVLCTKHPGFREEREWRVFHSPLIEGGSDWLSKVNEVVHGVPQEVVKLTLRNDPAQEIVGLDPAGLVSRVIIGPAAHPVPTYHAFFEALRSVGVENPGDRIWMSEIPLRQ